MMRILACSITLALVFSCNEQVTQVTQVAQNLDDPAIHFQAAGADVGGVASVSPTWPTHQADDVALLIVESAGGQAATLSNAQGFAAVTGGVVGDDTNTGGTRLTLFWKRATSSSEPAPTVADSGDHTLAQIVTFRGVIKTGTPWDAISTAATSGTGDSTFTMPPITTTTANTLLVNVLSWSNPVLFAGHFVDQEWFLLNANTFLTFTAAGTDGAFSVATKALTTSGVASGASGAFYDDLGDPWLERNARIVLALKAAPFITTAEPVYSAGQQITVNFSGLPGNATDWIAISPANSPATTYGQWFYTNGATSGAQVFNGLASGNYEARAYENDGFTILASSSFSVIGTQYYVDSSCTNCDTNSGTSPATPWQTFDNVNGGTFVPGDTILLRRGRAWSQQLHPCAATACSGAPGLPIRIDAYGGSGALPLIQPAGAVASATYGAVQLVNQDYWEISNLHVTNCLAPCNVTDFDSQSARAHVSGIHVLNTSGSTNACGHASANACQHIRIAKNEISLISGEIAVGGPHDRSSGIAVVADMMENSRWNDVVIEDNAIKDLDNIGIYVGATAWPSNYPARGPDEFDCTSARTRSGIPLPAYCVQTLTNIPSTNIEIRNNTIARSGGGGIYNVGTNNVLIEHNVIGDGGRRSGLVGIQTNSSVNTTIQNNEIFNQGATNPGGGDLTAIDNDWGAISSHAQRNYSHGNVGGFLMTWEPHGGRDANGICSSEYTYIDDEIARFNVSVNDGTTFIFCGSGREAGEPCGGPPIYQMPFGYNPPDIANNTIFLDSDHPNPIIGNCAGAASQLRVVGRRTTCDPMSPNCPPGEPCTTSAAGSFCLPAADNCNGAPCSMYFYNNIVYATNRPPPLSECAPNPPYCPGGQICDLTLHCVDPSWTSSLPGAVFDYNIYYGTFTDVPAESGPNDVYANPLLLNPLAQGPLGEYPPQGSDNLDGFKIQSGSPALGTGYQGAYLGTLDFWGNPVSSSSPPNIGAYNGAGL